MALTSAKEDSRKAARLPRNQKPAVVHSTYNAPIEACYHPNTVGLHTKEDAVHDAAGVTDRKLALDIATIDRHSKSQLKSRKKEEQALREMCRDLRKHVVFNGGAKSTHTERLALPQIGEGGGDLSKRKALSANNSPNTERRFKEYTRTIRKTGNKQRDMQNVSDDVQSESKGKHGKTLSADNSLFRKQSGTASDYHVHKDPLGFRANSSPTPTITVQHYSDDRTVGKGSRQPRRSVPVWELGLVPARRARTPGELMKASQKLPISSGKQSSNRHKAADNLTRMPGKGTGASDPRFERLEALLIPCSDPSTMSKSSSFHSFLGAPEKPNSSPGDIRYVRSAPSSPREKRRQTVSQKSDDGMLLTPRPPSSGHRSAPGSPLIRRPKIVITKQENILPRILNQEKEDNPNESVTLFDLSTSRVRLTPDPIDIVSPPPF